MNQFVITLSGVLLFIRLGGAHDPRHLVIPKIHGLMYHSKPIGDHQAYLSITRGDVDSSAWGSPDGSEMVGGKLHDKFFLNGENLTINAEDSSLEAGQHQSLVPSLKTWCPGYTLDSGFPIAASLDIDRGVLTAEGDIDNDWPVFSKLKVKTTGPLIIGVKGNSNRKLIIQPGADVQIRNEIVNPSDVHDHFLTYYAMSQAKTCDENKAPGHHPDRGRARASAGHGKHRKPKGPGADCSNSQYP